MNKLFSSWQLFALGSAFFASLTAIFGKIGVSKMNSDFATFIRTVVVLFIIALIVTIRNEWSFTDIPKVSLLFLVLSAVTTGFSWLCYYHALKIGPANRVAPIDKLSVILVIIFAAMFLKERVTWKVGLGGLLVTAGAVFLAF